MLTKGRGRSAVVVDVVEVPVRLDPHVFDAVPVGGHYRPLQNVDSLIHQIILGETSTVSGDVEAVGQT